MFTETATFYDAIYAALGKDYAAEVAALVACFRAICPHSARLLDVGCGTGAHLEQFTRHNLACRGLDKDHKMVALARARCPEIEIEPGDVLDFSLPERYDVITCLFAAIAYVRTKDRLKRAVANMAAHLDNGGALFVEPFIGPETYLAGTLHALFVDQPNLKIARMNVSRRIGNLAILDFHYLIGTKKSGIERHFERHELGLFGEDEYREAFREAGLSFEALDEPAFKRGLYVGLK